MSAEWIRPGVEGAAIGSTWTGSLDYRVFHVVRSPAKCDIMLAINDHGDRLLAGLLGDANILTDATLTRMVNCLKQILLSLVDGAHAPVHCLPLMPPEELQALQHLSCGPLRPEHLEGPLLHEVFTALAGQHPGRRCLVFDGAEMSYGQVNTAAEALAASLAAMDVVRGSPVGIMLDRSFELVIAILGVLKAGGGCVVGWSLPVLHQGC